MDSINFNHLKYFWMVAKEGSISKASQKLLVAQPTISAQIKTLETSFGQPLFNRVGRRLVLTDLGQMAFGYAGEIFSLGNELADAVNQKQIDRPLRLNVGIADSVPKLVATEVLGPANHLEQPVRLVCREGKVGPMLADMATYQLDMVLADETATSSTNVRTYHHRLGQSGVMIFGPPKLAEVLRKGFPESLDGAPALLPTPNTPLRRTLDTWFARKKIRPNIVAEFDDSAMNKEFAHNGFGFVAVHSVIRNVIARRYDLALIGVADGCTEEFFAISVERKLKHPAVLAITETARTALFETG